MLDFKDKRTQAALLIVLFVAITALRLVESETGPLYLIGVVMAAIWFGRWTGLVTGAVASILVRLTLDLDEEMPTPPVFAEIVRLGVYAGLGYTVGAFAERQLRLEGELATTGMELEELRTLQQALAPAAAPQRPSLELATCYIPAEHGVSGDFYLVAPGADDSTLIAVGDVAGRGLDAAKRAWYVRTLIASSADVAGDPAGILERANRSLIEESGFAAPFVTAACMVFHPGGRVEWALAGHDGPVSLEHGSPLERSETHGLPLGVADQIGCETASVQLVPGAGILLYTDGLTEARRGTNRSNAGSELFGERRIEQLLDGLAGSSSADILRRIQHEVQDFSGGKLADDLCMVALRVSGEPETEAVS